MKQIKFPHIFAVNIDELDSVRTDEGHIWGYEKWLVNDKELDLCCKHLVIFPCFRSSKHNHDTKSEYFQILSGELRLTLFKRGDMTTVDRVIEMSAGQQVLIPKRQYHYFETATRQFVLLLEVSTFEDEKTNKAKPAQELVECKPQE